MPRSKGFLIFTLIILLFGIFPFFLVNAQTMSWNVTVEPDSSYYLRGETASFEVIGNASTAYTFAVYDPKNNLVWQKKRETDVNGKDTVNLPINEDASTGMYTVTANISDFISTTWVTIVYTGDYVSEGFPYTRQHKGVNYTIRAKRVQAVSSTGNITINYPSLPIAFTVNAYSNNMSFVERLRNDALGIRIDLSYLFIHSGMKIVINGSIPEPTSYTFSFQSPKGLVKKLDALRDSFLVFDWSDLRKAMQAFSYDAVNKKLTVNIPKTFSVDPYIFEDGFESGFTPWTGISGSPTINQTIVHHGSNSSQFNPASFGEDYCYISFADQESLYLRHYRRFENLADLQWIVQCYQLLPWTRAWALEISSTTLRLTANNTNYDYSYSFQTDTWYGLEVKSVVNSSTNGELSVWLTNSTGTYEVISETGLNLLHVDHIDYVLVGQRSGGTVITSFADCVVIDDEYIGPEVANTAPTIGEFEAPSTVYANKYAYANCTVNDDDGKTDIVNATVQFNGTIQLNYDNATDTFSEVSDSSNYCTFDASNSAMTSVNATAIKLSFRVKFYWNYTEGTIFINGSVWDDEPASGTASPTSLFTFEDDLTVSSVTHTPFEPETGSTFTITGYLYYSGTTTSVEDSSGITVYLLKQGWQIDSTTSVTSGQWSFSHSEAEANVYYYEVYAETDETTSEVTEEVNVVKSAGGTTITPTPIEPTEPVTPVEPTAPITPTPVFQLPFSPLYIMVGLIVVAVVATTYQIQSKTTLKSARKMLKKKGLHPNIKFKKVKLTKKLNVFGKTKKKKKKTKWKKKKLWS